MLTSVSQDEDVTLQPARLGMVNCYKHVDIDTFDTLTCVHGFGAATEEQKQAALDALINGGDHLNEKYFLFVPAHELWLDRNLVGMCQFRSVLSEHPDSLTIHAFFEAIFLLSPYRGRRLSSAFVESIWSSLVPEYMNTIYQAKLNGIEQIQVVMHADFESQTGESVFNHLYETMNTFFESISAALGVGVRLRANAGY